MELTKDNTVPWGIKDIILFLLLIIFYFIWMQILYEVMSLFLGNNKLSDHIYNFINSIVLFMCLIFLKKVILKNYSDGWEYLISNNNGFKKYLRISFFLGVLTGTFSIYNLIYVYQDPFLESFPNDIFWVFFFYAVIIGPIIEETWFRSFIYRGIKKQYGIKKAFTISIVLFLLFHIYNLILLPLLLFSISITYFYEKTGSFYNCIVMHSVNNLTFLLFRQFLYPSLILI